MLLISYDIYSGEECNIKFERGSTSLWCSFGERSRLATIICISDHHLYIHSAWQLQGTKSLLRNYMIKQADAVIEHPPFARWIYDGMAILRILKPKSTYRKLMESLINVITPSSRSCPITIEMVNAIYLQDSIKNQTREKRGSTSVRTHLNSLEQKMLQGKDRIKFFNNIENKTDLVVTFFTLPEVRRRLETPLITNDKDTTLMITEHSVSTLFLCNHVEFPVSTSCYGERHRSSCRIKRHRCICSVGICLCEAGTNPPLVYED